MKSRRRNPILYQGRKHKDQYFEGWYYKLVSPDEQTNIALIPGISKNKDNPLAFLQVFLSSHKKSDRLETYYLTFDSTSFHNQDDPFFVQVGQNIFSEKEIHLDIDSKDLILKGSIKLDHLTPLKSTIYMPNIMGPFSYLPNMECSHGVVSMDHALSGYLTYQGEHIDFNNGRGYIEKDWGTSFPSEYVWMQTNHFDLEKTSFMFSYASIPFLTKQFQGLICVLYLKGKEYRFSTYQFARVKKEVLYENRAIYHIKQGAYQLEIDGKTKKGILLKSPNKGQMIEQIKEGLSGSVNIKLYKKSKLVFEGTGRNAGIEIMKK